ncbi:site-specific DNA-methyltransferase [Thermoactinomyces mirandus]|uniref:site-specific DNA-methyltransferase n=1 Tax=Thermoactinomyces mirandus TaxID=2756294 RepID=UPI0035E44053
MKQELSDILVEGDKERYQLTWPGKKQAILNANTPIDKTLRPVKEDSVNWDTTQNLYIEGDNLEVLKFLQESYLNKIKCIYIDPPYNTGKDFIYKDDFRSPTDEYLEESGQTDEEGNRLFQNTESNGRFHSDWLTMMYSRLKIARNLLRDDGVIFISIDDNEFDNIKKICDEIFGSSNFITAIPWQSRQSIQNDTDLSISHEYIVVYAKVRRQENRRLKESNIDVWFKEKTFAFYPLPLDESKFDNPDNHRTLDQI